MKKACVSCKKEFIPKKQERTHCSLKCYQNRNKRKETPQVDLAQLVFDVAMIIVPILIIAFAIFMITPKDVAMVEDDRIELVQDIPNSSCDDFEFEIQDEDAKFRDYILTGRGKK